MEVVEHLPRFAKQMRRITQVRTMFNDAPDHPEGAAVALSGFRSYRASRTRKGPHLGSVIAKFARPASPLPQYVVLGRELWDNGARVPGQYGGFLGGAYGPLPCGRSARGRRQVPDLSNCRKGVTPERFGRRETMRHLLDRFQGARRDAGYPLLRREHAAGAGLAHVAERPERLRPLPGEPRDPGAVRRHVLRAELPGGPAAGGSGRAVRPGELEPPSRRGRPGGLGRPRQLRRLLTDYPKKHFPTFDQAAPALLDDLAERGLLENTLVIFGTEFGRSPKINVYGGRDHWPSCYTVMFAGAGVEGGPRDRRRATRRAATRPPRRTVRGTC